MAIMKVCLPNDSKSSGIGGGWSFRNNLIKYSREFEVVDSIEESDLCLICGVTMITGDSFSKIKQLGKKVIIRLDGIPEAWRNPRIDIAGRMRGWCQEANGIVYQSLFTKEMLEKPLGLKGKLSEVIYNGTDDEVFKSNGETVALPKGKKILSVLWRQDPNKRWDEVLMRFRREYQENKDSVLVMVGDFPNQEYDFGFLFGERYVHFPKVNAEGMAKIMRSCDEFWFPSFADPCPNTLIEAIMCGLRVRFVPSFGGAKEIMNKRSSYNWQEFFKGSRMAHDYYKFFYQILNV